MIGPLNSQLNAIKWGEFKLGDLFEIVGTKSLDSNAIDFTDTGINFVGRTFSNNGIQGKTPTKAFKPNKPFTITATVIGQYKYVKFQTEPYYCSQNINKLTPKIIIHQWNAKIAYYFITHIQKFVSLYDGQQSGYKLDDIKNHIISLPTNQHGKIDFHFMEKFIAELEQCRLAELQAYLKAIGLENTTLSSDEENALNVFNNSIGGNTPCGLTWQSFRLGDLFEASNGDFDIQKRHINHKGEFVITAGLSNNGVLGQSDIKAKVFESHSITIDMFGCAFYRSFPYKMVTHARVFSLKPKFEINHKIGLFLSTLFFDYPRKFGYENMCSWAKIKNDKVILPLKPTANAQTLNDIDFHFMRTLINALMKQTIQGVAQYCDAKIQATKEAISQETPIQKDSLF
nr:restriction endonuclease subunit S [Helicobacter pylori]